MSVPCSNSFENVETGAHRRCKGTATHEWWSTVWVRWKPLCRRCAKSFERDFRVREIR